MVLRSAVGARRSFAKASRTPFEAKRSFAEAEPRGRLYRHFSTTSAVVAVRLPVARQLATAVFASLPKAP